jgi:LPXTG-motif cell wall-anchored protein
MVEAVRDNWLIAVGIAALLVAAVVWWRARR